MKPRRIFIALVIAVNLVSAAAFGYVAFKSATVPHPDYPSLDTWDYHAGKAASAP